MVYVDRDPVTGRERRLTRKFAGRGEKRPPKAARDLEATWLLEVGAGQHRGSDVTVGELLDRWLAQVEHDLSPTTVRGYRTSIEQYLRPYLGKVKLAKLTTASLDGLYARLRAKGGQKGQPLAPATVRQAHAVLRRALGRAVRWGWIGANPAVNASPPALVRRELRPPGRAEVELLLAHSKEMHLLVLLALGTGARRGELCGLQWSDVDVDSITIRRSVVRGGVVKDTKTHAARQIAIGPRVVEALKARRSAMKETALACGVRLSPDAYVLSDDPAGREPLEPHRATERFRSLTKRAGVKCRLHDLRHAHVTGLLAAGIPVADVAARAGHADAHVTLTVYGHASPAIDRRAALVADEMLG